ncbi:MAG: WecB/TagA/CpsF family glycosyltransferase, partial [Phycisphaeraceae bacterium]
MPTPTPTTTSAAPVATTALPTVTLAGVPLHAVTEQQAIGHILAGLDAGTGGWVVTPNLDHLRRLTRDAEFRELCLTADLRVADGMPLIWAARLQRTPLPERVAGSQLIWSLTRAAGDADRSVFLLGGEPGTADAAARILQQHAPGLRVVGTLCPPPGFEDDARFIRDMADTLVSARPDIVYVALGSPKQERLIARLRPALPDAWWLGVGISFSFVAGHVRRAPRWMQRLGLEWVHRLAQEPRRLARRYLLQGLPFAARLLATAALPRPRHTPRHTP